MSNNSLKDIEKIDECTKFQRNYNMKQQVGWYATCHKVAGKNRKFNFKFEHGTNKVWQIVIDLGNHTGHENFKKIANAIGKKYDMDFMLTNRQKAELTRQKILNLKIVYDLACFEDGQIALSQDNDKTYLLYTNTELRFLQEFDRCKKLAPQEASSDDF